MKILIIGQALPAIKQEFPYDTTLLYKMLEWVGIDKMQAQDMFDFDALVDTFPGFTDRGGHKVPGKREIFEHYHRSLKHKIKDAEKIILLGNPARDYLQPGINTYSIVGKYLFLPHPSTRNQGLILKNKEKFTLLLKEFLN